MTKAKGLMPASTRHRIERTAVILEAITAAGPAGITSPELDAAAGIARDATMRHLGRLRREGLVVCIRASWNSKYVLTEYSEKALAERDAKSRDRWNEESRKRQTRLRRQREANDLDKVLNQRQRVVSASECKPVAKCGPCSIWDFAAAVVGKETTWPLERV